MFHVWRAGCDRSPAQFQLQPEIVDNLVRKQADEIRTATSGRRNPERFAAKSSPRRCNHFFPLTARSTRHARDKSPRPARYGRLQNHNVISGFHRIEYRAGAITCHAGALGKAGGHAQNDDIVLRFHFEFGRECMLTSNMARQTSNNS